MLRSIILIGLGSVLFSSVGTATETPEPPSQRVQEIAKCIDYISETGNYERYMGDLIAEANNSSYIVSYMFEKPFERRAKAVLGEFDHAEFARESKKICHGLGVGLEEE